MYNGFYYYKEYKEHKLKYELGFLRFFLLGW